ncbi:MAG: S9 family peptidase [Opitutae bacterium]|nr:S9 family peptidase [Opitutae bacterium]
MPPIISARLASVLLFAPLLGLCAPADSAAPPAPTHPGEIPVESFFRPRSVRSPQLNPAGTHLALLAHDLKNDANSLAIFSLADMQVKGVRGSTDPNIGAFTWADDERLVFSIVKDNHYAWGLYAANRNDPYRVTTLNSRDVVQVLGVPRQRPDSLLIWVQRDARYDGRDNGVQEIDLRRNQRNPGDVMNVRHSIPIPRGYAGVRRWLRDRQGEIRYAAAHSKGRISLLRRDDDKWAPVAIDLALDEPLAVDTDPNILFVAHRNATGARDLMRFNTTDGSHGPVLYSDEKYDFGEGTVHYSAAEKEIIGLVYARQAPEQVWLRDEEAALQRRIDAALPPNHLNLIASRSRDGKRLIIRSSSDRHPGSLYLFDRDKLQLKELTAVAPWLPERLMAPVRLMTYKARDGLKLDGYVTLPLGHDESKPGPVIVLPHGGPWHRDVWGYDPESQFYASRGYIVFRPNYRGSTGYNDEISHRPRMEFRRMHDDVTDGVRALVAAKIADPAHLAIVGASFGGYLAVAGAAFEPGLYQCAVSYAGVFDVKTMMKDDRDNDNVFRRDWFRRELGDPEKNREKFEAMSPLHSVDKIKVPLFIAHGTEDNNADTEQSHRLVKALKKAGVPHEAMFIPGESHGLAELKHRVDYFTRVEAFLKKHL